MIHVCFSLYDKTGRYHLHDGTLTPDGLEFKPLDDLETPVRNDNPATPAQLDPNKKFSLSDFIRTD